MAAKKKRISRKKSTKKKVLNVLIEPVFEQVSDREFLSQLGVGLPESKAITLSAKPVSFKLRIELLDKVRGKVKLKLKNIEIYNQTTVGVRHTFDDKVVEVDKEATTDDMEIVFPLEGLYWMDMEVEDLTNKYEIQVRQRLFTGKIARGWSENETPIKKNKFRTGIIVLDGVFIKCVKRIL